MTADRARGDDNPQTRRFLALYALAWAGGTIAYAPFLTLLLPLKVVALNQSESVSWLATLAFAGAIMASLANVAFGWFSDRTGGRRAWIVAGLVASTLALPATGLATSLPALIAAICAWQVALNMMLAPLAAWAGDTVPDAQKGLLGGLISFAPAFGAISGAFVTWPGIATGDARLLIVAALVVAFVSPVLLFGRPVDQPQLMRDDGEARKATGRGEMVGAMWFARLLVQISEAALFAFLLVWLRRIDPRLGESEVAWLFGLVLASSVPLALGFGGWADRRGRPIVPLIGCALVASIGLILMGLADSLFAAIVGYVVFGVSGAVFLALHSAQTLRILPRPGSRGRDLGIFNLTNTVPSLVMPGVVIALVPRFGFSGMFLVLALLALSGAALLVVVMRKLRAA